MTAMRHYDRPVPTAYPSAEHTRRRALRERYEGRYLTHNQARAQMYARAEYHAWSARHAYPPAVDPLTGRPFAPQLAATARAVGRARDIAAARA
jgi:hypothetical protein